MSEQKVSITLCGSFLCTVGAAGGCHYLRIIVKGMEHKIKDLRSERPFICTHKFPGNQRVYISLNEKYLRADEAYDTLDKKREIPELPPCQHLSQP